MALSVRKCHRPRPVSVSNFRQAYEQKQKHNGFMEEFEELKEVGNKQSTVEGGLSANALKNRYPHILPYDHSRVKLTLLDGDLNSGYINASYIPGFQKANEYIATQAPTPASLHDFWRMVWEQRIQHIVMLTLCEEHGKILCDQYWPSDVAVYGLLTVQYIQELHCTDWITRHFTLCHVEDAQVRYISQLHYTRWPDCGIPETPASLVNFVLMMRQCIQASNESGPILLHCSAGVGRTGTLIALDVALQQMKAENFVDIYSTVYEMRLNRFLMLQTLEQYIFVHRCIRERILQEE